MRYHSYWPALVLTLLLTTPVAAKTLFLSHWNGQWSADIAAGNPEPLTAGGRAPRLGGAGYPFTDSMPAIAGLTLEEGQTLGYSSVGNINPREGTVDFWFYQRQDYKPGAPVQLLFSVNAAPTVKAERKPSRFSLQFGGPGNALRFVVLNGEKEYSTVYNTEQWSANVRWHRIAISWSASRKRISLFVDGRLASRTENVILADAMESCFYIGSGRDGENCAPHDYDELRILDHEITEIQAAVDAVRKRQSTAADDTDLAAHFAPLDIRPAAKIPLKDDVANDHRGGWTDQGPSGDMHQLPPGAHLEMGIPFITGDACIAVAGSRMPHYPQQAILEINNRYDGLLFAHTAAWLLTPHQQIARYVITYADAATAEIPLVSQANIGDWSMAIDLPGARAMLRCPGSWSGQAGSYAYYWANPHPDKIIRSVTFESGKQDAVPFLLAITAVKPDAGAELRAALKNLTNVQTDPAGEFAETAANCQKALAELPDLTRRVGALVLPETPSFMQREMQGRRDDALTYLAEIQALIPQVQNAIAHKRLGDLRQLQKIQTYLGYIEKILTEWPTLERQAPRSQPMKPLTPTPVRWNHVNDALRQQIILNGTWEFSTGRDPDHFGQEWKPITIPTDEFIDNRFWLRKSVSIPPSWNQKKLLLHFECSRVLTEVYINRKFAGRHIGIEPFDIDASSFLVPGATNEVLLYIVGRESLTMPYSKGIMHLDGGIFCPAGLSHDVTLQAMPAIHLSDAFLRYDSGGALKLSGQVIGRIRAAARYTLNIELKQRDQVLLQTSASIAPGPDGHFELTLPPAEIPLWGIGGEYRNPNLFTARLRLLDGDQLQDDHSFRTGLRSFGIHKRTQFQLNGRPLFLQGDHLWGSEAHAGCSNRAFIMRFFRIARGANFNIVRIHFLDGGNIQQEILDAADEAGFALESEGGLISLLPQLSNGDVNYDDPVLRKNSEIYFTAMARKMRKHPSVLLFSLSNEVFMAAGSHMEDAAKFYKHMEQSVARIMPDVVLTEQGNNARNDFPTLDLHYANTASYANWRERGDRPIIHGEWSLYESGYFEMNMPDARRARAGMLAAAEHFSKQIKEEIRIGYAGTMPFPASMIYGFSADSPRHMGPWADLLAQTKGHYTESRWYLRGTWELYIPVPWPALSGPGVKKLKNRTGSQSDNINFFDPSRPEFTANAVYDAFKSAFLAMPPLAGRMSPEVIITAPGRQSAMPIMSTDPQTGLATGVLPDDQGRAWFVFPHAGRFTFSNPAASGQHLQVELKDQPIEQKPGFDYIPVFSLDRAGQP